MPFLTRVAACGAGIRLVGGVVLVSADVSIVVGLAHAVDAGANGADIWLSDRAGDEVCGLPSARGVDSDGVDKALVHPVGAMCGAKRDVVQGVTFSMLRHRGTQCPVRRLWEQRRHEEFLCTAQPKEG